MWGQGPCVTTRFRAGGGQQVAHAPMGCKHLQVKKTCGQPIHASWCHVQPAAHVEDGAERRARCPGCDSHLPHASAPLLRSPPRVLCVPHRAVLPQDLGVECRGKCQPAQVRAHEGPDHGRLLGGLGHGHAGCGGHPQQGWGCMRGLKGMVGPRHLIGEWGCRCTGTHSAHVWR